MNKSYQAWNNHNFTQVNSNIATINYKFTTLEDLFVDMKYLTTWVHQFKGPIPSEKPSHQEGIDSSHSMVFHSKPLSHHLHIPTFEVNKFDVSDPMGWVTQMEHYFTLHGITDELIKLHVGVLYLEPECWNGGNGVKIHIEVIFLGPNFLYTSMDTLKKTIIIWVVWPSLNIMIQLNTTSLLLSICLSELKACQTPSSMNSLLVASRMTSKLMS